MIQPIVVLKNVSKSYGATKVLDCLNLTVARGEFVAVLGESGEGKSTLMNIIGLLDSMDSGEYLFNGETIPLSHYARTRNRHIGFVFQLYHLLPTLTVFQNIILPFLYSQNIFDTKAKKRLEHTANILGLDDLLYKKVDTLSGGEKQRVAVARAMVLEPDIVIADEPTGALDEKNSKIILKQFEKYAEDGKAVLMVTHNTKYAQYAQKQYLLTGGLLSAH